jgi:4-amino-4-deoxy-L-arabinose transferase-like glycosyltransferase
MQLLLRLAKNPFFWLFAWSILYAVTRLYNLTGLPIFTDEAIYIRWSQIGAQDASWRFISLTDGKQPLFTWFAMAALRVLEDPLFAGRLVSVCSGFLGMIGMYLLGFELFRSKKVGVLASFLYLISPFALMYDRMAIYDSLVAAISIWNLYITVLFTRYVRLDIALIFGLTLGFGMLNKTSAFFSLYLLPFSLVLFDWRSKHLKKRLCIWIALGILAAVLSQMVYSILRLSPYFYIIAQKNTIFVYPFTEWLQHPFTFLFGNLRGQFDWLIGYMTYPMLLILGISLFSFKQHTREKMLLFFWWILPFFALALFGKVLYPRFILFMVMPLYVIIAYEMAKILSYTRFALYRIVIIVLISSQALWMIFGILTDITHANIPKSERGQYINEWPSGWGVAQIVETLKKESEISPIAVYTEGTFGLLPYALEIYLANNPRIKIQGVWPPPVAMPEDMQEDFQTRKIFYITNFSQTPPDWSIEKISEYQKGDNPQSRIRLYRITALEEKTTQ